jgi:hypothetical protein
VDAFDGLAFAGSGASTPGRHPVATAADECAATTSSTPPASAPIRTTTKPERRAAAPEVAQRTPQSTDPALNPRRKNITHTL